MGFRKTKVYPISACQFLRQHILRMSVGEFGVALGISPTIVCRYTYVPEKHRNTVMRLARERKVKIDPAWLVAVPWGPGVPQ